MSFLVGVPVLLPFILPGLVFVAETCVVTLGTVRTICVARGRKILAAALGFFEVSIWLFAIGQIMQNLSDWSCYLAFATGFSLGNFLGVLIERRLALGNVVVQVTTKKNASDLVERLRSANYGVTTLDARGATGPVLVIFTVIKRKELEHVVALINDFDSRAFYSINDLQSAAEGIAPAARPRPLSLIPSLLRQRLLSPWPASHVVGGSSASLPCREASSPTENSHTPSEAAAARLPAIGIVAAEK